MLKSLATVLLLVAAISCQNSIDTRLPIVRTVSGLSQFDYFSYSMVLHQRIENPSTRAASLDTSRIIVSAPMYNIPGSAAENTGAIWECPINSGSCERLNGDNGGADRRLYDLDRNGANENKTNQFLGGSMASNGDFFIVCAHRYKVRRINGYYYPHGQCYYSDRDLSGFTSHTPCSRFGSPTRIGDSGVCNAGTSAVITSSGSAAVYGVGAPGSYLWRGSVTRLEEQGNVFDNTPRADLELYGLFGYTMVTGLFASTTRQDYAVSNPRFSQRIYYIGRVRLVTNDQTLAITNQPLNGQQMGEYYGFSLLAANMAGDVRDELIVGAPMYRANGTAPDTGRIYIYSNTNGALSLVRTIVGREAFGRFGYAMANLGDINGDNYDDIAVSAPFGSAGGSVFIYYSSSTTTISPNPAQIITGETVNMNLMSPNNALTGFGTTLASGVDVDRNAYNDLAVGSFVSQEVYLLRTRPLTQVSVTVSTTEPIVDLDMRDCNLRGTNYACFPVETCVTYTGSGLSNSLDLTVTLVAERQNLLNNLEQRIFFDNGMANQFPSMISSVQSATLDRSIELSCFTTTAYVQNGITDRFNGFTIETVITPPTFSPAATDGNVDPMDLSGFPVVSTSGVTMLQVETLKDCNGNQICIPDLRILESSVTYVGSDSPTELTVGAVSQVNIRLRIMNEADDAFQATLTVSYRTNQLSLQRVYNNTANGGRLTLICSETKDDTNTYQTCNIGNPLNSGSTLTVNALFSPRPELVGNEGQISVGFSVDSVNDEQGTDEDNSRTQPLTVNARAAVGIDPGQVFPESVSYANFAPEGLIVNVTQLGPSVTTTFTIRNGGPSTVPTIRLSILWPTDGTESVLFTFIYPASISSDSTATVVCSTENINPISLQLPVEDETGSGEGQVVTGGKRRRRRRSVPAKGRKVKRQGVNMAVTPVDTTTTINRNFSCADTDTSPILNCFPITCDILGLQGGSNAQVEITAYIDERFFSMSNDRFSFHPYASVAIVDADYILNTPANTMTTSTATIQVISAGTINPDPVIPPFPWYAVVFPLIAVIIIIAAITVGLYFCGFFRRAKHEEIKQKREELQNLAENEEASATDKDGLDGTNL